MRIVDAWPPNIEAIRAAFPIANRTDIVFAFADRVFAPGGQHLHPATQAHERVHCERQAGYLGEGAQGSLDRVLKWWDAYILHPAFRLAEEIPAHRAEYLWWATRPGADKPIDGFRSARLYHLNAIAVRLASPLYGRMINLGAAKKAIEGAA